MRKYRTENLRDVIIMSQSGAGKTSLGEAFLFNAKATSRLGKVLDGNSVLDFEPEEVKRQSSIFSALHTFKWKNYGVVMLDTPGDNNFTSEAILGLKSADNALFVIDAIDSIKPYSENLWKLAGEEGVTRTCFINKMDRERANFDQVLQDITEVFEMKPLPLVLPIGAEESFAGVVDVLKKKAFLFEKDGSGAFKEAPVPADMEDQLEEVYGKVIEDLAEVDDALMEKYLEGGELSQAELDSALSAGLARGLFLPVFCGSALLNMGVQPLLDFMVSSFISPDRRAIPALKNSKGETKEYKPSEDQPLCGYVFKTMSDPYTGTMSIVRCLSGTLSPDSSAYNARSEIKERIGSLIMLEGKAQKPLELVGPGDIFAVAKLKETGVEPIALGGKDAWPAAHWYYFFALRQCSQEALENTLATKDFSDACWLRAGESLADFAATEPFNQGFLTTSAQQGAGSSAGLVANYQAAMELMGACNTGVIRSLTPDPLPGRRGWRR